MTLNLAKDPNTLCVAVVAVHLEKEDKCVRPDKGKERRWIKRCQISDKPLNIHVFELACAYKNVGLIHSLFVERQEEFQLTQMNDTFSFFYTVIALAQSQDEKESK